MNYTFTNITSFTDAEFDHCWSTSEADMLAGSYPFHLYPQVTTTAEKKQFIKDAFTEKCSDSNWIVWKIEDEDTIIMLNAGQVSGTNLAWEMSLIGQNNAGSKSWMYDQNMTTARNTWLASIGCTTMEMCTPNADSKIYNHCANKITNNKMNGTNTTTTEELLENNYTKRSITMTVPS
jgi:hypothetical protein